MEILTNKQECLAAAIEVAKEFCKGGGSGLPSAVIEDVYKKLIELYKESYTKE
jgi:hypothetical protein